MLNLIKRNTPAIADSFILETTERMNGKNYYEISEKDGRVLIKGDCKISQAMGYYTYLKKYCRVNFAHCGNIELNVTEAPLPTETTLHIIDQERRAYLNYCTLSYSMRAGQWDKWEKEISAEFEQEKEAAATDKAYSLPPDKRKSSSVQD